MSGHGGASNVALRAAGWQVAGREGAARQASFRNEDVAAPRRVELYYEETHFATLQPGAVAMAVRARARSRGARGAEARRLTEPRAPALPPQVNTYVGHRWFVHVDGAVAREWVVDAAAPPEQKQEFVLRAAEVEEPFGEFA